MTEKLNNVKTFKMAKNKYNRLGQIFQQNVLKESRMLISERPFGMLFGKYKGYSLEQILNKDIKYLYWLLEQDWVRQDLKNSVKETLSIDRCE